MTETTAHRLPIEFSLEEIIERIGLTQSTLPTSRLVWNLIHRMPKELIDRSRTHARLGLLRYFLRFERSNGEGELNQVLTNTYPDMQGETYMCSLAKNLATKQYPQGTQGAQGTLG